jgi:hypothetical protein
VVRNSTEVKEGLVLSWLVATSHERSRQWY